MDKIMELLKKLGIELTADQTKQLREVAGKEFVAADEAAKTAAKVNGSPIIRVPSERMYTEYTFNSGSDSFGFTKTETAKLINWIICPRNAPIAVSKTDGVKIFDPNTTQGADAWTIEYRKFHDIWVKDNKLAAMRASVAE